MRAKILIVDDDRDILLSLENRITWMGHEPVMATNGKEALRLIQEEDPDLVLLDLELPLMSGLEVLQHLKALSPPRDTPRDEVRSATTAYTTPLTIMLTAYGTIERAVHAMQLGAFDFVPKPFTADHLTVVIHKALDTVALHRQVATLRKEVDDQFELATTASQPMNVQLANAKQAASSTATILVLGETGTGKELVARAIHRWSPRHAKPFIAVNCAAFPENLLENELFGHEKGAYTGAAKREPGKIEMAEGGTLFLDEIGDMPLTMQSHLLRVLNDRTFYRVGGTQEVQADVRFIAATNKNLQQAIRQGTFREDLYFRLAVIPLNLPPLRERLEDVPSLVHHFLSRRDGVGQHMRRTVSPAALEALARYTWPGNVRELENVLTRALILCPEETIEPEHLSLPAPIPPPTPLADQEPPSELIMFSYHKSMEAYSHKLIESALERSGWNQTKAAELLGLQRTYLTRILREKQITRKPGSPVPQHEDQGA